MDLGLQGSRALITGGSKGIGFAIADVVTFLLSLWASGSPARTSGSTAGSVTHPPAASTDRDVCA